MNLTNVHQIKLVTYLKWKAHLEYKTYSGADSLLESVYDVAMFADVKLLTPYL